MHRVVRTLLCALPCVLLVACSQKESSQKASLVAVKVNGDELSVPQVNAQLQRMQGVPEDKRDAARKQVVDGLVDQQLFVQQARELKLDRDPEVLAATEASRAQILAQAYTQKALAAKARPSEDEISKYYAEHPELFSSRRVFRLQEVATDVPPERVAELEKAVAKSKTLAEVVEWLKGHQFKSAVNGAVRGAEMLPMHALAKIHAMKDGEMAVIGNGRQVTVLQVMTSQAQPLDQKQATPYIEQFLSATKREQLVKAELERLRREAKIHYVGEFAKLSPTPAGAASAAAAVASPAASAAPLDKGIAGLR